jgi:hypothetical protein
MAIELFDHTGQLTLDRIREDDVAALDEPRKAALNILIDAVLANGAAHERHTVARARVRSDMVAEEKAHADHIAASDPHPFKLPPSLDTAKRPFEN